MKKLSVILPHRVGRKVNDEARMLCLKMLKENADYPNKLEIVLMPDDGTEVYQRYNDGVEKATGEIVMLIGDDMLMASHWDSVIYNQIKPNTLLTGYVMEPGIIGVATENIQRDFGYTVATFDRAAFEQNIKDIQDDFPEVAEGHGWYQPLIMYRADWLRIGGYPPGAPFPFEPRDMKLFESLPSLGITLLWVRLFCYHFQALSQEEHDHKRSIVNGESVF